MDNISFKSKIRFVTPKLFEQYQHTINPKFSVPSPWTINETAIGKNAYTNKIYDCTSAGINDGDKVMLFHLCPCENDNMRHFGRVKRLIKKHFDLTSKNLQAFVLGGKFDNPISPYSIKLFNKFLKLFNNYDIPTTYFKGGPHWNNIAYFTDTDEWIVSNIDVTEKKQYESATPDEFVKNLFDEIKICEFDKLSW